MTTHNSGARSVERELGRILYGLASVGAFVCLLMSVHVFVDVVIRSSGGSPLPGTLDIVTNLWMPVLVFSGFALAESRREHITVDILTDQLNNPMSRLASAASYTLYVATLAILTFFSFEATFESVTLGQTVVGSVQLPIWPAKIYMVVCLVAMLTQVVITWVNYLRNRTSGHAQEITAGSTS